MEAKINLAVNLLQNQHDVNSFLLTSQYFPHLKNKWGRESPLIRDAIRMLGTVWA